MSLSDLPPLDCHAHIAPDVTPSEVDGLGGALVFAMTRTPREAGFAVGRPYSTIAWGFGVHPGLLHLISDLDAAALGTAVKEHVVIGEVGLDRRGPIGPQLDALEAILTACHGQAVLLSLHSTGRTGQLIDVLKERPHPGAVLHWFNGSPAEICEAVDLGCYFSVNNAMSDDRLKQIPSHRMLPESDFPASRKTTLATKPGDTRALEQRLARRDNISATKVRRGFYRSLAQLAESAGVRSLLPRGFQNALDVADDIAEEEQA